MVLRKTVASGFAAAAVTLGTLGGALLPDTTAAARPDNVQVGGASGLVAAVVGIQDLQLIDDVNVAFRDINVVRNVLNNSPVLNNNDVEVNVLTIEDALNGNVITLADLVDADVALDDVVAVVQVLGGGVLILT